MNAGRLAVVFRPRQRVQFNMRLRPEDQATLFKAARSVRLPVSAYLLRLHHFAIGQEDRQP